MAQAVSGTDGSRPGTLLADRAYVAIRDRVLTLQLPPGSPIDEDELIRELGIGRTPIREAIKRLALEDLVTVYPRRGTFVSDINITDLAQISDLRIQLRPRRIRRQPQLRSIKRFGAICDGPNLVLSIFSGSRVVLV